MKKVFLTIALAAFAFAANAQFVLGGQVGFNSTGGSESYTGHLGTLTDEYVIPGDPFSSNANRNSLTIMPKIGYQLNDKMQVGAKLGLIWTQDKDFSMYKAEYAAYKDFEGWYRYTYTYLEIAPYFRYNVAELGSFTLFCEASLSYSMNLNSKVHHYRKAYTDVAGFKHDEINEDQKGYSYTNNELGIQIVPGLNYKLSDNFSADLYLNVARLAFTHYSSKAVNDNYAAGYSTVNPDDNQTVNTQNEFSFGVDMSGYDLTNLFSIGINYHF